MIKSLNWEDSLKHLKDFEDIFYGHLLKKKAKISEEKKKEKDINKKADKGGQNLQQLNKNQKEVKIARSLEKQISKVQKIDQDDEKFLEDLQITMVNEQLDPIYFYQAFELFIKFKERINLTKYSSLVQHREHLIYKSCLLIAVKFLDDLLPDLGDFAESLDVERTSLYLFERFVLEILDFQVFFPCLLKKYLDSSQALKIS